MHSKTFITNQSQLLSEVINNMLPSTSEMYFLIGYFYFSGFEELYRNLADKQMKILVGMEIQKHLTNKIIEFEIIDDINKSRGQVRQDFNKSLVDLFNDTDFFDTAEKQYAFKLFLTKIKDGSLEIELLPKNRTVT